MKIYVLVLFAIVIGAQAKERIAGGNAVEISAYPFAAALLTNSGVGTVFAHACGGCILTAGAILSAASCFYTNGTADDPGWWRARVGSSFSTRGGTAHLIRRITPHPSFNPTTRGSDIAVLHTTLSIAFSPGNVAPARIVGGAFTLDTNQPIWAIGWGVTSSAGQPSEQLRAVQFWVVNQQTCSNRYQELAFTVTADMVCTGWLDVGVFGQCRGDAGSPLVIEGAVVGVHSWAEGCADSWFPGINTRVSSFVNWIVDTSLAA